MSSEVTTGYGNLQGYELYDLVALSDQEYAVVIHVGSEKLKVIDNKSTMNDYDNGDGGRDDDDDNDDHHYHDYDNADYDICLWLYWSYWF